MGPQSRKVVVLLVILTAFAGTGWGLHKWLTQYYLPVRDVEPILTALQKGDTIRARILINGYVLQPNGTAVIGSDGRPMVDSNGIHIRGRGKNKIKQLVFERLNRAETHQDLGVALGWLMGVQLFDEPFDHEVIEKAITRYNAGIPDKDFELPWSIRLETNGYYYIYMGGFVRW